MRKSCTVRQSWENITSLLPQFYNYVINIKSLANYENEPINRKYTGKIYTPIFSFFQKIYNSPIFEKNNGF